MASLNPYAPPFVPAVGDSAPFLSLFSYAYGYPFSDALPGLPATLPPPCRPLSADHVLQMSTSSLVPVLAPQPLYFCYSTDCYYQQETGVEMGFPSPCSTQTFVGVAAPFPDPSVVGLPFYPAFPILQEDLLPPPSAWHPPAHRPVQPEILELPPTPLLKSQRPSGKPPRRAVLLRKRVKVSPRWKFTVADISATEVVGGGTVRRPPRRSGHEGLMNSWVPRLRSYWRKTPGEVKSYEKFQFKTGGLSEENSRGLVGDVEGPAGDARTTVMIKNLPNKLTKEVLLSYLSRHCREENCKLAATCGQEQGANSQFIPSRFDFFYLPMDFGSGGNLGYAFVNFTSAAAARRLHRAYDSKSWRFLGSNKVCEVTYARIQGLRALIKHFKNSIFRCDRDELLPVYFLPYCDGTFQGRSHYVGRRVSSSHHWRRS